MNSLMYLKTCKMLGKALLHQLSNQSLEASLNVEHLKFWTIPQKRVQNDFALDQKLHENPPYQVI